MKRYVLRVQPGKEREAHAALTQAGCAVLLPRENRLIRSGGKWLEREYLLMPGYLFVDLERCNADTRALLVKSEFVSRVLCDGNNEPVPLTPDESAWIDLLCAALEEPSTVQLRPDGGYRVAAGALGQLSDRIVSIDRHARRVQVALQVAGKPVTVTFSVYLEQVERF